jgi:hypothetical protein
MKSPTARRHRAINQEGENMKTFSALILFAALIGSAVAKDRPLAPLTPELVQHAASGVVTLKGMMKDPDSFVLESVSRDQHLDEEHPERAGVVCYSFRSHNAMGGFASGSAWMSWKGTVSIFDPTSGGDSFAALLICRHQEDITAQVRSALDPVQVARAKFLTSYNSQPGKRADIVGSMLTLHSAECSHEKLETILLTNSNTRDLFISLQIKMIVYTNDADLKFFYDVEKNIEVTVSPTSEGAAKL